MASLRCALAVALCLAAAPAAADQPIRVSASEKAACLPDAIRYCRDAMPNIRNVLVCFSKHRSKISGRCNAVLASYGL